jgi:hypothetical protein
LAQSEIDEIRAALVKVYGNVAGNKYIDDALAAIRTAFDEAYDLIKNVDASSSDIIAFDKLLNDTPGLGAELAASHKTALLGSPSITDKIAVNNHARSQHTTDIVEIFKTSTTADNAVLAKNSRIFEKIGNDYDDVKNSLSEIKANSWVRSWAKTELSILRQPAHTAADIPDALDEFTHTGHILADDLTEEIRKVPDNFAESPIDEWQTNAKASSKTFSARCWEKWNNLPLVSMMSTVEQMMVLSLAFVTAVLGGIYLYTTKSTDEPAITSLSLASFTKSLERFFWPCKNAADDGRWTDLEAAIKLYAADIDEAEAALARHETVQKANGTYDDFYECLMMHKFNLGGFRNDLDMCTLRFSRRSLRSTSPIDNGSNQNTRKGSCAIQRFSNNRKRDNMVELGLRRWW